VQADVLDAVATYLSGEMGVPVYYPDLPRSLVEAPPRTKMMVITPGGSIRSGGDDSYIKIVRARADLRCYGENQLQALRVYREAAEILKGLTPRVVNVGAVGEEVGVKLYNATLSNGPLAIADPDTKEIAMYATWGVMGSEEEVGAVTAVTNPLIVPKLADELFTDGEWHNDADLHAALTAGHIYRIQIHSLVSTTNPEGDGSVRLGELGEPWKLSAETNASFAQTAPMSEDDLGFMTFSAGPEQITLREFHGIITPVADAEWSVGWMHQNSGSGDMYVHAGSFIELFDLGIP